jgi:hypothetical protein
VENSMTSLLDITTNKLIDAFELKLANFFMNNGLELQNIQENKFSDSASFIRDSFDNNNQTDITKMNNKAMGGITTHIKHNTIPQNHQ